MQKRTIFIIGQEEVFRDLSDMDIESIEKLKVAIAVIHSVNPEDIEVRLEDCKVVSKTTSINEKGLQFRADNDYAFNWQVSGLKDNFDLDIPENLEKFLDAISSGDIDSIISFS